MIGDTFVIDAVAHPFNMSEDNLAMQLTENPLPSFAKEERFALGPGEQLLDFPAYATAHALFAESQADMAVLHALPRFAHTLGPFCDVRKVAAMRDRWPNRFLLYGTVDTMDADEAIRSLEHQVAEHHIDGVKVYPAIHYQGAMHGWKMDDREFAIPLFEAVRDLGIRNVAVHKIIPVGTGMEYFRVGDFETPLGLFPEINFHVVHAGYSFLEEFNLLFEWFPNLYANLENTIAYAVLRPRVFAEVLGELLYWGSADRICSGSGVNLMHPRPPLEAMHDFVMPEDLIEGKGYPVVTDEIKRLILGGNIARVHDVDVAAARDAIAGDEFEVLKRDGLREPWSGLREPAGAGVA
jgi:predicted TIM-barrel fold metal-dependent hydrolase